MLKTSRRPKPKQKEKELSSIFFGSFKTRLKSKTLAFRFIAEINIILGAWYLHWRLTNSLNFDALWLAIPLLIAEIYSFFGGVLFIIGMWRPLKRKVKSLDKMLPPLARKDWGTVDVLVTCYNEPVEIIEKTAASALQMDYPAKKLRVYILDDGNSPVIRDMAQKLCLKDLSSPQLRAEAERIDAERSQLIQRLRKLESLTPQIEAAEDYITENIDAD